MWFYLRLDVPLAPVCVRAKPFRAPVLTLSFTLERYRDKIRISTYRSQYEESADVNNYQVTNQVKRIA